jgi:hypothetical protein
MSAPHDRKFAMSHSKNAPSPNPSSNDLSCSELRSVMGEVLDGRLARSEQTAARAHLLRCPECRREYARLEQLGAWTRALAQPRLGKDFQKELFARIHSGEGASMAILPQSNRTRGFAFFASGMATAAALLLSAWLLFSDRPGEEHSPQLANDPSGTQRPSPQSPASDRIARRAKHDTAPRTGLVVPQFPDRLGLRPADLPTVARRFVVSADENFERAVSFGRRAQRSRDLRVLRGNILPPARESYLSAELALRLSGREIEMPPATADYLSAIREHSNQLSQLVQSPQIDWQRFEQSLELASRVKRPDRLRVGVILDRERQDPNGPGGLITFELRRLLPENAEPERVQELNGIIERSGFRVQIQSGEGKFQIFEIQGRFGR